MYNQRLKEKFFEKCNNRMKGIMQQAITFEDTFTKDLCNFDTGEIKEMLEGIKENRNSVVKLLQTYTEFAIEQGYSVTNINFYDLI